MLIWSLHDAGVECLIIVMLCVWVLGHLKEGTHRPMWHSASLISQTFTQYLWRQCHDCHDGSRLMELFLWGGGHGPHNCWKEGSDSHNLALDLKVLWVSFVLQPSNDVGNSKLCDSRVSQFCPYIPNTCKNSRTVNAWWVDMLGFPACFTTGYCQPL